ncbi:hypothetical protein DM02DRAFT_662014 [Periconia macrospinosa]|uniref:Uncharacterized protein n=1 Tax=Periconia macrospinosa TaxID=97972 RepID=A0A2V1D823_9PLEO|nr:hypothetical protein DM02DRAFT_662014 [Periconia macrospinosa]
MSSTPNTNETRNASGLRTYRTPDMNLATFTGKLLRYVFDPIFDNDEAKMREIIDLANGLKDGEKQLKWTDKDPKTLDRLLYQLSTLNAMCSKVVPLWELHGQHRYAGVQNGFTGLRALRNQSASQYNLHMQLYYILLCFSMGKDYEPLFTELNGKEEIALLEEGLPKEAKRLC